MSVLNLMVAAATAFGLILIDGGLYEFLVIDPFWPTRPDLIQPARGGISRKRFWIPVHSVFELALIASLVMAWSQRDIRFWLVLAFVSHAVIRIWSAVDFIPKALAFEKAAAVNPEAAQLVSPECFRFRVRSV